MGQAEHTVGGSLGSEVFCDHVHGDCDGSQGRDDADGDADLGSVVYAGVDALRIWSDTIGRNVASG